MCDLAARRSSRPDIPRWRPKWIQLRRQAGRQKAPDFAGCGTLSRKFACVHHHIAGKAPTRTGAERSHGKRRTAVMSLQVTGAFPLSRMVSSCCQACRNCCAWWCTMPQVRGVGPHQERATFPRANSVPCVATVAFSGPSAGAPNPSPQPESISKSGLPWGGGSSRRCGLPPVAAYPRGFRARTAGREPRRHPEQ